MICNADECEPGTFKDRQILAEQPHLVLEGMLLAMLAIGAEEGWDFIRHEYSLAEQRLREASSRPRARASSAKLRAARGSIFVSPGGYVLGEETALINASRAPRRARNKPPYPARTGCGDIPR